MSEKYYKNTKWKEIIKCSPGLTINMVLGETEDKERRNWENDISLDQRSANRAYFWHWADPTKHWNEMKSSEKQNIENEEVRKTNHWK